MVLFSAEAGGFPLAQSTKWPLALDGPAWGSNPRWRRRRRYNGFGFKEDAQRFDGRMHKSQRREGGGGRVGNGGFWCTSKLSVLRCSLHQFVFLGNNDLYAGMCSRPAFIYDSGKRSPWQETCGLAVVCARPPGAATQQHHNTKNVYSNPLVCQQDVSVSFEF